MRNPSKDLKHLTADSKIFPICIPSYSRPNATILHELKKDPKLPVILFIQDEQKELYKDWYAYFKIVRLKNVNNIGETRAKIVDYAYHKGYEHVFMFDDDISKFNYLVKGYTKKGSKKLMLNPIPINECQISRDALRLWSYYISLCDNLALSGVVFSPFSWMWNNTHQKWIYNKGVIAQIFSVNVRLLKQHDIQYKSNEVCFNEDTCIQFECMNSGLNTILFKEFTYYTPICGTQEGGCAEMYGFDPNKTKKENFESCLNAYSNGAEKLFNLCNNPEGLKIKQESSGRRYVAFIWDHWKKPYTKKEVGISG